MFDRDQPCRRSHAAISSGPVRVSGVLEPVCSASGRAESESPSCLETFVPNQQQDLFTVTARVAERRVQVIIWAGPLLKNACDGTTIPKVPTSQPTASVLHRLGPSPETQLEFVHRAPGPAAPMHRSPSGLTIPSLSPDA